MESTYLKAIIDHCTAHPERTAVVSEEGTRTMSYGELMDVALKTVAYLAERGIGPQAYVCVLLPPCAEYMAVEIGIWLARCIAVPMGDKFPQERVSYIQEHSDSPLTIDADVLAAIIATPIDADTPYTLPDEDDGALLIYTSGSTGKPKGILHNHSTLVRNNPRVAPEIAHNEQTRFGAASPFYFVTILGSYDVLYSGGQVHILSDACKANAAAIEAYVEQHDITICHISPAVLTQFHNRSRTLRAVITGGEKLTTQHSQEGYRLYNMFGMSETGGAVMSYEVAHASDTAPLGRGINQVVARVVDEQGCDVPPGVDGELVLRGPFCAGYHKDPERTRELYRDGWLHTGDLARTDEEGTIHYVNRKDWMLKINGQRVEPGEIESAMERFAPPVEGMGRVARAIVQGVDNGRGSKYLCGYYVSSDGQKISPKAIISFLDELLPHYMVPLRYVHMDAFPLNANGKIDRKNLPLPQIDRAELEPLESESERRIAHLFCELLSLDIDDLGAGTSFFEVGGDSIMIMRLCGRLREELHCDLSPTSIYESPTIRGIAEAVERASDGAPLIYQYSQHEERPSLVFVHTGSTGSEAYYALAGDIKDCCSFSVIEQYNIYHPDDIQEGLAAVARKYIEILKAHQPHGPYNLGGWCYGGMIAYEMACQLKEAGEDVGNLIMIDSYIMNSDYDRRLTLANQVEHVNREYYETSPLFADFRSRGMLEDIIDNSRRVGQNMADYEPRGYNGRVHYFKALNMARHLPAAQRTYFAHIIRERAGGYERYIPDHQLTIYEIPEHHDGMMSDTGRSIIAGRIRSIMRMEEKFLEAERLFQRQTAKQ